MTLVILIACAITLITGVTLMGAEYGQTEGRKDTTKRKTKSDRNLNRKRLTKLIRPRRKNVSDGSEKTNKGITK